MLRRESVIISNNITRDATQDPKEKNSSKPFEWTYKTLCREENVKPLPAVQTYLQKNCLRFCADHVNRKDWSPILNGITQDRSLSQISVYSRCRRKKIREKVNTEEKLMKLRRCAQRNRQQPVLYANFLLRCFIQSLAVCLKNSLMITNLELDGIPLTPRYVKILSDGLANNRNLQSLSLIRCRIGDAGCDLLLEGLQSNSNLHVLNLSSCCLTNRSATCLSLYLKKRRMDLLQSAWNESTLSRDNDRATVKEGLQVLVLNRNYKFGDIGLRNLVHTLKNDFWLKKLCLRFCGITKRGGQIMLELLQTNNVITQIDLRENEISTDTLQMLGKFLKEKKTRWKRISMQKKLLNHEHIRTSNTISKSTSSQFTLKKNKHLEDQDHSQLKIQDNCISQIWCPSYIRKITAKNSRMRKLHDTVRRRHNEWPNVQKSQDYLSLMIKRNQNLIAVLENSTDFLMEERNRRLSTEEAYHKLQPRLRSLKNKVAAQDLICSNPCCEDQDYANLLNVFEKLTISVNKEKCRTKSGNLGIETGKKRIDSASNCDKSPQLVHLWHKKPDGLE